MPWVTVETLTPDVMSVATVGGEPRDFAGVRRTVQRQLAKMPALYDSITTNDVLEALHNTLQRGTDINLAVPTNVGPHMLLIRPVPGPTGSVHGLRFWLGPAGAAAEPPGEAVGAVWDLGTQTFHQPVAVMRMSGVDPLRYLPTLSIAELFQRVSDFDRHGDVLEVLFAPESGGKLQFELGMGKGRWRATLRAHVDANARGVWWLLEDAAAAERAASRLHTLEQVGLREAHRRAGTHLAVVHPAQTCIAHWLTDPPPWVRWDYLFQPVDVFHPQDRAKLAAVSERVRAGGSVEVAVRTLDYTGGYRPTSLLLYPYPGAEQFAIGQFDRTGDTVNVEPCVHIDTIGYDEQLRRHLAVAP